MGEVKSTEEIKALLAPLLEKGFTFVYENHKGGDSSCVYVSRFKKGKDFFDWREVSGSDEINFVVFVRGQYRFPNLKTLYKKEMRKFAFKHLFKKATVAERRTFYAELILRELEKPDFFGITI